MRGACSKSKFGGTAVKHIRILLADDLSLVREGIRAILSQVDDIEIVGEASNGPEAFQLARQIEPNVVLMDEDMPDTDCPETVHLIKQALPNVEIIIMTDRLDAAKALQAIEAGATGYFFKNIPAANLTAALRSVCNGRAIFEPEITRKLVDRLSQLTAEERFRQVEAEGLTPR